jgi:hypothetical protein
MLIGNAPSGVGLGTCDSIGEVLAVVARTIDSGKKASVMDAQGSVHFMINRFNLM